MVNRLRRNYRNAPDLHALASSLGVSYEAMKNKAYKLHLHRATRKMWRPSEEKRLARIYADTSNKELADIFCCKVYSIESAAFRLGLHKSHEYLSEKGRQNCHHPAIRAAQFKPGHTPSCKGKKEWQFRSKEAIAKCALTRFKPGRQPPNALPVGCESVRSDGYVYIKAPGARRMQLKHRYVYEQHYGPVPPGYCIISRDGNRQNCSPENLALVSRADNARRNTAAMTKEQHEARIAKSLATRSKNIRLDRIRLHFGLPTKGKLVKRW